jgi:hypothetical protein
MLRKQEGDMTRSIWSADEVRRQRFARQEAEENVPAVRAPPQHTSTPRGVDITGPPRHGSTPRGVDMAVYQADGSAYQADGSGYVPDGVVYVSSGTRVLTSSTEAHNGSAEMTPLETRKSQLVSKAPGGLMCCSF